MALTFICQWQIAPSFYLFLQQALSFTSLEEVANTAIQALHNRIHGVVLFLGSAHHTGNCIGLLAVSFLLGIQLLAAFHS